MAVFAGVNTNLPNRNYSAPARLPANNSNRRVYFHRGLTVPVSPLVTVRRARLFLTTNNGTSGSVTLRVQPVSGRLVEKAITAANAPAVTGTAVTATKTGPNAWAEWEFDITTYAQQVASGAVKHYGWRVTVSGTSTAMQIQSTRANRGAPRITLDWVVPPEAPAELIPSGVIATATPTLQVPYTDLGSDRLSGVHVQDSAGFDTGERDSTDGLIVTADEPGFTPLSAGVERQWRGRVRDSTSLWSPWSDWHPMMLQAKPTVAITSTGDLYAPTVLWSVTGTQDSFSVSIAKAADPGRAVYSTGRVFDSTPGHTVPPKKNGAPRLKHGVLYRARVRVWDRDDRAAGVGEVDYAEAVATFRLVSEASAPQPSGLEVDQAGESPVAVLTWTGAALAGGWAILADGVPLESIDTEDAATADPTRWRYECVRVPTDRLTQVEVRAVGESESQSLGAKVWAQIEPVGSWLIDETNDRRIQVHGTEDPEWTAQESSATYTAASGRRVRHFSAFSGLEATITGSCWSDSEADHDELMAALSWIKTHPTESHRFVHGGTNIPVIVSELVPSASWRTAPGDQVSDVSFHIEQDEVLWQLEV